MGNGSYWDFLISTTSKSYKFLTLLGITFSFLGLSLFLPCILNPFPEIRGINISFPLIVKKAFLVLGAYWAFVVGPYFAIKGYRKWSSSDEVSEALDKEKLLGDLARIVREESIVQLQKKSALPPNVKPDPASKGIKVSMDDIRRIYKQNLDAEKKKCKKYISSGKKEFKKENFRKAFHYFDQAISADYDSKEAWYWRGLTAEKLNKKDVAKGSYKVALHHDPEYTDAKEAMERVR